MNKKTLLLSFFVLGFLFLTTPSARAIGFLGFDFPIEQVVGNQLDALSFVDDTLLRLMLFIALLALESSAFLMISANLLDWTSSLSIDLGTGNSLVTAGWNFTTGLVNMLFILIFIAIALSYIFKAETWGMKKALPRLIIMALLINFSLLFVKIFVDIGWILQNSLKETFFAGGKLATALIEPLTKQLLNFGKDFIIQLIGYFFLGLLPFGPALNLVRWGSVIITEILSGAVSQALILIIFNFVTGLIFFIYAILFLVRIVVIWFLAIAAPLAFVAFILTPTQKFFHQWLRYLLQWTFLGIIMLFLMGLGIKLFVFVTPPGGSFAGIIGEKGFFEGYTQLVFLIIYLVVVLGVVKKAVPTGGAAIWGLGEMAVKQGSKWAASAIRKRGSERMAGWERGTKETAERVAVKLEKGERVTLGERLRIGTWTKRPEKALEVGLRAEAKEKGLREKILVQEKAKVLEKAPKEIEDRRNYLRAELLKEEDKGMLRSLDKIAAILDIIAKEGKIREVEERFILDAIKRGVNPDRILERRPDLAPMIGKSIAEAINKLDPVEFRTKVQKEAFQGPRGAEVVMHLLKDESKFLDITLNAKTELKNEILNTLNTLTKQVGREDLALISKRIDEFSKNPKWRGIGFGQPPEKTPPKEPPKIALPGSKEFGEEQEKIRKKL